MLSNAYLSLTNDGFNRYKEPQERFLKQAIEMDLLEPARGYYGPNKKVPQIQEPLPLDTPTAPIIFHPHRTSRLSRRSSAIGWERNNLNEKLSLNRTKTFYENHLRRQKSMKDDILTIGVEIENRIQSSWVAQHQKLLKDAIEDQIANDEADLAEEIEKLKKNHYEEMLQLKKTLEEKFKKKLLTECKRSAEESAEIVRRSSQEIIDAKDIEVLKSKEEVLRRNRDYEDALQQIMKTSILERDKASEEINKLKRSHVNELESLRKSLESESQEKINSLKSDHKKIIIRTIEETRLSEIENQRKLYEEESIRFHEEVSKLTNKINLSEKQIKELKNELDCVIDEKNSARVTALDAFKQLERFLCAYTGSARKQMDFIISPPQDVYLNVKWKTLYAHKAVQTANLEEKTRSGNRHQNVKEKTKKYLRLLTSQGAAGLSLEDRLVDPFAT